MDRAHVSGAGWTMLSAALSKLGFCQSRIRPVLTMYRREVQKMRRRNFPKGYAEMLDKQHNQLVRGLQEMYQRLRRTSLWEGEPLDESSGRPLTYNILAALNLLEPIEEYFIEQPWSSPMIEEPDDDVGKTPADSSQEVAQPTPQVCGDSALSPHTTTPGSPSAALSPTTFDPCQLAGQSNLQSYDFQRPPEWMIPAGVPRIQIDILRDDLPYCFDTSEMPLSGISVGDTNCCFRALAMLLPPMTQASDLSGIPSYKRTASALRLSLCHRLLSNGVGFDSSDFVLDLHHLSSQDTTGVHLYQLKKAGSLS
jgi:hypothetical protein